MTDIIRLLPDSVSNQIAAGEVIQRPASVVKELVENAIDAGSTEITMHIKEGGKILIQVIDNGCGMSETDARLSFERHATSKIHEAVDLYSVKTLGFRGEALASVAAVAQIELKTRKKNKELGTIIKISATNIEAQEPVQCNEGSNFIVKNLFFNVPARRKFLKSNTSEFNHILEEFRRVALVNTQISFSLFNNNQLVYNLPATNARHRISGVFGKNINLVLIPVKVDTSLIKISGFIGKPEFAKKTSGEQYFFVNNRFMKHPYFHKAITEAYGNILPPETIPSYFICFDVNPSMIDVNIHPNKTEIKFEEEFNIWKILMVVVREALGKFNVTPALDFTDAARVDIPMPAKNNEVHPPHIEVDPTFNPFKEEKGSSSKINYKTSLNKENISGWEKLYAGFEQERMRDVSGISSEEDSQQKINPFQQDDNTNNQIIFQFKKKFIVTQVKSGLMFIDQHLAHLRVLFEKFVNSLSDAPGTSQMILYPVNISLNPSDALLLKEILDEVNAFGFEIHDNGDDSFEIRGIPADITGINSEDVVVSMIGNFRDSYFEVNLEDREKLAYSLARASAINYGKTLSIEEMSHLMSGLFSCSVPNYSPSGKPVITIISIDEISARLKQ